MSIQVKKHPAELLMDFITRNTKLYINGSKSASVERLRQLDHELYQQLVRFFEEVQVPDSRPATFFDLLNVKQKRKLARWERSQDRKIDEMLRTGKWAGRGSIPSYQYIYEPCGIGPVIRVKNNYNGEEVDLTDVSDW